MAEMRTDKEKIICQLQEINKQFEKSKQDQLEKGKIYKFKLLILQYRGVVFESFNHSERKKKRNCHPLPFKFRKH